MGVAEAWHKHRGNRHLFHQNLQFAELEEDLLPRQATHLACLDVLGGDDVAHGDALRHLDG